MGRKHLLATENTNKSFKLSNDIGHLLGTSKTDQMIWPPIDTTTLFVSASWSLVKVELLGQSGTPVIQIRGLARDRVKKKKTSSNWGRNMKHFLVSLYKWDFWTPDQTSWWHVFTVLRIHYLVGAYWHAYWEDIFISHCKCLINALICMTIFYNN